MRKVIVIMMALLVVSVPVFANLLVNGDFEGAGTIGSTFTVDGWTSFKPSWATKSILGTSGIVSTTQTGDPSGWNAAANGSFSMAPLAGKSLYFGSDNDTVRTIYQVIDVTVGQTYVINGQWTNWGHGDNSTDDKAYWFQVQTFSWDGVASLAADGGLLDVGAGVIVKRAAKNLTGGLDTPVMGWQSITDPLPTNTNGNVVNSNVVVATQSKMVVALTAGTNYSSTKRTRAMFDNFTVEAVPEPCSLFALGTGLIGLVGLRRRK